MYKPQKKMNTTSQSFPSSQWNLLLESYNRMYNQNTLQINQLLQAQQELRHSINHLRELSEMNEDEFQNIRQPRRRSTYERDRERSIRLQERNREHVRNLDRDYDRERSTRVRHLQNHPSSSSSSNSSNSSSSSSSSQRLSSSSSQLPPQIPPLDLTFATPWMSTGISLDNNNNSNSRNRNGSFTMVDNVITSFLNTLSSTTRSGVMNTRPPTQSEIQQATRQMVYSEIDNALSEEAICPISFVPFQPETQVTQIIPCRHVFASEPLQRWLTQSPQCPVCRYNIHTYQIPSTSTTSSSTTSSSTQDISLNDTTPIPSVSPSQNNESTSSPPSSSSSTQSSTPFSSLPREEPFLTFEFLFQNAGGNGSTGSGTFSNEETRQLMEEALTQIFQQVGRNN